MSAQSGMQRILLAFVYSAQGLRHAWRHEAAFRQEAVVAAVLTPTALFVGRTGVERAVLIAPLFFILVIELLNTAIEAVVDRFGAERHPLAGMAKDMGSAAVMLSFALLVAVWLFILVDH